MQKGVAGRAMLAISDIDVVAVKETVHRLIPSRFPPVDLYARVASSEDFEILHEIESLTNPRLREEVGDIALVPKEDRIFGPGTPYIMAAFTHPKVTEDGGRFNRGFGVFYAAREFKTALAETKYHRAKFFLDFDSGPTRFDMRALVADLNHNAIHTIAKRRAELPDIYHLTDYSASQALGLRLKQSESWGLQYDSVRAPGTCYAIMRPPALSQCLQTNHYEYHFNGKTITHVLKKTEVK